MSGSTCTPASTQIIIAVNIIRAQKKPEPNNLPICLLFEHAHSSIYGWFWPTIMREMHAAYGLIPKTWCQQENSMLTYSGQPIFTSNNNSIPWSSILWALTQKVSANYNANAKHKVCKTNSVTKQIRHNIAPGTINNPSIFILL